MHEKDQRFLEESFKKYYFEHADLIHTPPSPQMREFGYQKFNSGMVRHLSIKSDQELHLLLMTHIPSDVYCSNARYLFPTLQMAEKEWQDADLIFDVDAKDLNLPCRQHHSFKKCTNCSTIFVEEVCPVCKSSKFELTSMLCSECINAAKLQVKMLNEILSGDFGIKPQNIEVYFSGNEGFHVYVYDSGYEKLDSRQRAEIVDYLMLRGILPETIGAKYNFAKSEFADPDEKGWPGRISRYIFGSKSAKPKISKQIISEGYSSLKKRLQDAQNALGVKIDPNVTVDVHRIFRLGGTLNSKSGLAKTVCKDISKFNANSDASYMDGDQITVRANCPVQFKLKNKKFGPYKNEQITIPRYAAVYMVCKGCATTS